jgi:hypothetical protein
MPALPCLETHDRATPNTSANDAHGRRRDPRRRRGVH